MDNEDEGNGMDLQWIKNITMIDCEIINSYEISIIPDDDTILTIRNCDFVGCGGSNGVLGACSIGGFDRIEICNNKFEECYTDDTGDYSGVIIQAMRCKELIVEDNEFVNCEASDADTAYIAVLTKTEISEWNNECIGDNRAMVHQNEDLEDLMKQLEAMDL